jgi:hypothetical protein
MTFNINDIIGKTIQIRDITADVIGVENDILQLNNISGYHNIFHHVDTFEYVSEWYQSTVEDTHTFETENIITIPSSYSNVYITFNYTLTLYINTLPPTRHIFNDVIDRDEYFTNHPDELIDNRWIKMGRLFYLYDSITESWNNTPINYIILSSQVNSIVSMNTGIYENSTSGNPSTGTYNGISKDSDDAGTVFFNILINSTFNTDNWYKLKFNITDLKYTNCRGEELIDGEGCIPKSYISERISVLN